MIEVSRLKDENAAELFLGFQIGPVGRRDFAVLPVQGQRGLRRLKRYFGNKMSVGAQMVVVLKAFVEYSVSLILGHPFKFSRLDVSQADVFHGSPVFPVTPQGRGSSFRLSDSRWGDRKSTATPIFFTSTAESSLAGIAALVPVGSGPELSHTMTEPQLSCRACGTYLHGLNAPGNNLPIRHVPTTRRSASDRLLDHHTWQLPRHDLAVQPVKAEFVAIGCKAQRSVASRSQRSILPPHEPPQSQPAVCKNRSGGTPGLSSAMPSLQRSALGSRANDPGPPAKSALQSERFSRRGGIPVATSEQAAQ